MNDKLKRNNILEALLTSKNIEEASKKANVSRKTIYSYLHNDLELMTQYRNLKREQLRDISESLTLASTKAVTTLTDVLDDVGTEPKVKVQASSKILEMFMSIRALENDVNRYTIYENKDDFDFTRLYEL